MGFCAQGPGPVIKITGTKERRQSDNAFRTWLKEKGRENISSLHPKMERFFFSLSNGHLDEVKVRNVWIQIQPIGCHHNVFIS